MKIANDITELVGNTPLVKLKRKIWNTFYKGRVNQISYFGYFRGNTEASPSGFLDSEKSKKFDLYTKYCFC